MQNLEFALANITQDTCISLLATRLKIQLILLNYCGKDKAHYISPKAKYSGLHFYFELISVCLLQFLALRFLFAAVWTRPIITKP